jgi:hypothetical protein
LGCAHFGEQFKLFDALPHCKGLSHEDNTGEGDAGALAAAGLDQQVQVGGDKDPAQGGCSVQQIGIGKAVGPVLKGGEDIEAAEPQAVNNGLVDVVVEVEANGHGQSWLRALSGLVFPIDAFGVLIESTRFPFVSVG